MYDEDYLARKMETIRDLCTQNNARAYILPQRRTCRQVLWGLHDKVSETLKQGAMNVHFDHLIRSCVAGMHEVPPRKKWHKRWVIDIDCDDIDTIEHAQELWNLRVIEPSDIESTNSSTICEHMVSMIVNKLRAALVRGNHELCAYREDVSRFMPTVTECYAEKDIVSLKTPHGWHIVTPPFNRDPKAMKEYFGGEGLKSEWIKPDAMTLLYAPEL